ncbi:MAG TPA: hypothetical protein EYQ31_06450 [Candidatus Handelsmanbacteria bacterium]|nr:hypothetical protein [Candidatus Handelsmanbacteria bacterium]
MTIKTIRFALAVVLLATQAAQAIGYGDARPRAMGLAGAYTAMARGAESLYWNPANLALKDSPKFSFALLPGASYALENNSWSVATYNDFNGNFIDEDMKDEMLSDLDKGGLQFNTDLGVFVPLVGGTAFPLPWGLSSALALPELADEQQQVEVETIGLRERRELPRRAIAEAIEPTLRQQLQGLATLVSETGLANQLSAGLVLAGNGAQIEGLAELAERSLSVPVRLARPRALLGLAELVNEPGDCALVGAALLWSRNELPSWESPERRARAKRNTQPRWFDLLM